MKITKPKRYRMNRVEAEWARQIQRELDHGSWREHSATRRAQRNIGSERLAALVKVEWGKRV